MTSVGNYFRWNVLWSSTECPSFMSWWYFFGKSKVNQANVSIIVDHKIFRLQVSVAIVALVQVSECFNNTRYVESTNCIIERAVHVQCAPQIT